MKIEFTGTAKVAEDGGVLHPAKVDGQDLVCHFSYELLEELDPDNLKSDPMAQFESHKFRLLSIAEQKILRGLSHNGVVNIFTSDL
jgi:hypothetical protein